MSNNFYSVEEFLSTQKFKSYGENVRVILEKLIQSANNEGVNFVVKIGKGKNEIINFSYSAKPSVNLCAVYIHREHIRVKFADGNEVKVSDPTEIPGDGDIIFDLLDRYREVNRGKRQQSIYVYSDVMDKIEVIAKKDHRNVNEIIEQFLDEKTAGLFINIRHRSEFRNLMIQANMFRDDLDYSEQKTYQRIAFNYLIAAYQGDYKRDEGAKFKIVLTNNILDIGGPVHLFGHLDDYYDLYEWREAIDSEIILGFARFILRGSQSEKGELQDILQAMEEIPLKLAMNSFKILRREYILNVESENILTGPNPPVVIGGVGLY